MKNNKERETFIRNSLNWQPAEVTDHCIVEKLTYKGSEWYRIVLIVYGMDWDYDRDVMTKRAHKMQLGGYYTLNEEHNAFVPVKGMYEIRDEMRMLDKQYPDRAGGGPLPKTLDIRRKSHEQ